jgi:hypothetical protein
MDGFRSGLLMKKFTFWRNAIVAETYVVEAKSEEEAREMIREGAVEVFSEEWIDWLSDDFELEDVEEIDPLYRMVKDYKSVDSLA